MTSFADLFGAELLDTDGKTVVATADKLKDRVTAVYFSAHWCPPCRGFTPKLAETYTAYKEKGLNFEVVFVSSDRDEQAFDEYFQEQPWLALPYADRERKDKLSKKFKVRGIPTLVILDADGSVITTDGRSAVSEDPTGAAFPWKPKPVSELLGGELVLDADTKGAKVPWPISRRSTCCCISPRTGALRAAASRQSSPRRTRRTRRRASISRSSS